MENNLIVIENGQLNIYLLDNQVVWEVGRMSKEHTPDIPMHATTISRRHGRFQNMDGIWFYMDENPKNGTIRNQKKLSSGLHGRVKPVMVSPGGCVRLRWRRGCGRKSGNGVGVLPDAVL